MASQLKQQQPNMFGLYHFETAKNLANARMVSKGKELKPDDRRKKEVSEKLAREKVSKQHIDEFLAFWSPKLPALNTFLSSLGTVDAVVDVGKFFYLFRRWGYSGEEITKILVFVISLKSTEALRIIELTLKHGPKIQKSLEVLGSAGLAINVFTVGVQCAVFAKQGEYSQVAATIYKSGIGSAVKWAGALDAIQSLLEVFVPESLQKNKTAFKVFRAIDPVGLGGVGVDSVIFFAQAALEALNGKSFDERRLAELVKRMKTGPTRVFAEIGEGAGDALYDIMQWDSEDWKVLVRYSWQELTGAFRNKSL